MQRLYSWVQTRTENYLTKKKARKLYEKQRRSFVNELLGWLDAIVFAVVVVFLLNQFLFQFYVIPSPSMQDTLLVKDRVLVSKLSYGIEVFPHGPKIFDNRIPDRDEIITFYNPRYESKGAFFNLLNEILFRITFSLVNLDVDEDGNMRESLLVKRSAGAAGDTFTFDDGNAYVKLSGTGKYVPESEFRASSGLSVAPHRTIEEGTYVWYRAMGRLNGLSLAGVAASSYPRHLVSDYNAMDSSVSFTDLYEYNKQTAIGQMMANPMDFTSRGVWAKYNTGVYVPEGYVLPLGDNRDNSSDGRYFGPVDADDINGHLTYIIWPLSRFGSINE